jgi:lipoprotein-releasing system ATP-binding protein
MLIASNIFKSHGDTAVLKGIDLTIGKQQIVSIIGKSGAGKSTLLHILGTLDKPDKGAVFFNNQNLTQLSERELSEFRNKNMGFIFQFHHLLPEFNALENVLLPFLIGQNDIKAGEKKAREILGYLNLSHRLTNKPSQLSGGEQQRVAVARALINDPIIIFADEPSGNLDTESSTSLHELFLKLRDDFGQSLVIVTHNQELAKMSNEIIKMSDGTIVERTIQS